MIYTKDNKRYPRNMLNKLGIVQPLEEGFSLLNMEQPMFNAETHKLKPTPSSNMECYWEVVELCEIDKEVMFEAEVKKREKYIDEHIRKEIQAKGYGSEDSIAKYLVDGNPYYEEAKTISLWIGNIWATLYTMMTDVKLGKRPIPSYTEMIDELPELL
jgi:hypothetical protein